MKKKIILIIILIIIAIIAFKVYNAKDIILRKMYPTTYSEYVEKYADEYNIDPLLIYSIIKAESNFNPNAKSSNNAMGLMQILESTAKEIGKELDVNNLTQEQIYDPETNIHLGVKYFFNLLIMYDDNINLALIAYNAGFGNVDKWIANNIIEPDGSDIENVPFKETNSYVRKILRDYEIYKDIYK